MAESRDKTWLIVLVSVVTTATFLGMAGVVGYLVMERREESIERNGENGSPLSRKNQDVLDVMTQYESYIDATVRKIDALNKELESCKLAKNDSLLSKTGKLTKAYGCCKQKKACVLEMRDNLQRINVYFCPADFVSAWTIFIQELDRVISVMDRVTALNLESLPALPELLSSMSDEVGEEFKCRYDNLLKIAESYGYEIKNNNVKNIDFFGGKLNWIN